MTHVALFLSFLIFGSTGGEIAITRGMKATGEPGEAAAESRCCNFSAGHCATAGFGRGCR